MLASLALDVVPDARVGPPRRCGVVAERDRQATDSCHPGRSTYLSGTNR